MYNRLIGFIGQGWIGKHYADDFEQRGFKVVRYAMEEPHVKNGDKIKECDIVFIAVPTPTTKDGFDSSILKKVIEKVGKGKIAVIKSTILPGTTELIQKENPDIYVVHSPEFLVEATAKYNAENPDRNIIGITEMSEELKKRAEEVMEVLPRAPFRLICSSREAEFVKYGGNCFLFFKVIFANLFYDIVKASGCDWGVIKDAVAADPRIGKTHLNPVHDSGRGAGGHCFIKDFQAFVDLYKEKVNDEKGNKVWDSLIEKNIDLLVSSGKDLDLLKGVYGDDIIKKN